MKRLWVWYALPAGPYVSYSCFLFHLKRNSAKEPSAVGWIWQLPLLGLNHRPLRSKTKIQLSRCYNGRLITVRHPNQLNIAVHRSTRLRASWTPSWASSPRRAWAARPATPARPSCTGWPTTCWGSCRETTSLTRSEKLFTASEASYRWTSSSDRRSTECRGSSQWVSVIHSFDSIFSSSYTD